MIVSSQIENDVVSSNVSVDSLHSNVINDMLFSEEVDYASISYIIRLLEDGEPRRTEDDLTRLLE